MFQNEEKTGGNAFPIVVKETMNYSLGMTLMDYFAGQALMGMCANPDLSMHAAKNRLKPKDVRSSFSQSAYDVAKAMIAERNHRVLE